MSLRKSAVTLTVIVIILVTLLPFNVAAVKASGELVKNWSFEDRDVSLPPPNDGVYGCPPWETNKPIGEEGGWRELKGDIDGDGEAFLGDLMDLAAGWEANYTEDPDEYEEHKYADLDGNGEVFLEDLMILSSDWKRNVTEEGIVLDGVYSWYTSGGGDYQMWQWLDIDAVKAVAGETVMFNFYFYPESVAPDGSQNNARAEIYYEYPGGSNTVTGVWVGPTYLDWWNAYVIADLPSTIYYVEVIIHGKPDFKAWVDLAQLTTYDYNLYYAWPPYDNLDTYPENGHCIDWGNAKVCVYADKSTGQTSAYSLDWSGIGSGREAYAEFNKDPVPGNSPQLYEGDDFSVGAYWVAYGHLGQGGPGIPCMSSASIMLYLYYLQLVGEWYEWVHVETYVWIISSYDYPNQDVLYQGSVSQWISSPPSGSGYYTIAAKARTYAIGSID